MSDPRIDAASAAFREMRFPWWVLCASCRKTRGGARRGGAGISRRQREKQEKWGTDEASKRGGRRECWIKLNERNSSYVCLPRSGNLVHRSGRQFLLRMPLMGLQCVHRDNWTPCTFPTRPILGVTTKSGIHGPQIRAYGPRPCNEQDPATEQNKQLRACL